MAKVFKIQQQRTYNQTLLERSNKIGSTIYNKYAGSVWYKNIEIFLVLH